MKIMFINICIYVFVKKIVLFYIDRFFIWIYVNFVVIYIVIICLLIFENFCVYYFINKSYLEVFVFG